MEPLPYRIEALPRPGQFAVSLQAGGQDRTIVVEVVDGEAVMPEAGRVDGWAPEAESYRATMAAVLALHQARRSGQRGPMLLDVEGGWDVSLGNVVLSEAGRPSCVAHGDLEATDGEIFVCAECGARARYGVAG